ncbi:MAG TPA: YetF domain-containing protein [Micromonosporaceae bacterium]
MFGLHTPPLEMIIRGSVVYLSLYLLLRVVLKRESGTTGVTDLLVIVLLADAAQNAMAGDYTSIGDGLILVATIIAWSFLLNFIAFHFPRAGRFIRPRPLPLVKDGRVIPRHMRRELITREELMSQLRQQGVADLSRVKLVYMEPDGQFSVVTRKEDQHQPMRHGAV